MKTTPETIAELKRLLAESTPRPWYRTGPLAEDETGVLGGIDMGLLSEPDGTDLIDDPREADYDLIAAAVNALPSLLADLEAAQAQVKVLREALLTLANAAENQAYRLALLVPPAHCEYVSKSGAANNLNAFVADARAALAATEVKP